MKKITCISLAMYALLTSCDPEGCEKYVVNNQCSDNIRLEIGNQYAIDTIYTVAPGNSMTISNECCIGCGGNQKPHDTMHVSGRAYKLYRIMRDTVECKKSHVRYGAWESRKNGRLSYEYSFTVNDSNF